MVQLNRIRHEGLDRRYILDQITRSLAAEEAAEEIFTEKSVPLSVRLYSSESAQEEIQKSGGAFLKLLAKIAFKYKDYIKRIPILGDYAIRVKESYLIREGRVKDVTGLLSLDVNHFLNECYREFLNREADPKGFAIYQRMICEGAPKEAILYIFAMSEEFSHKILLKHSNLYKKAYKKYRLKRKIKKLPLLGYLISLVLLPKTIKSWIIESEIHNANYRQELQILNNLYAGVQSDINNIKESLTLSGNQINKLIMSNEENFRCCNMLQQEIQKLADSSRQTEELIDQFNSKMKGMETSIKDVLFKFESVSAELDGEQLNQELVNLGILGIPSYLGKAKEGTDDEIIKEFSEEEKFYYYLGNLFRGSEESIKNQQMHYLKHAKRAYENSGQLPFVDIGCGRGEFLEILKSYGIESIGIDTNEAVASGPREKGLNVIVEDGMRFLKSVEDSALSGVSMFQVVEHMEFNYVFKLCSLASRKISPGGCIIIETINPYCYRKLGTYSLDPSHIYMPSPDALKLMLEMLDFQNVIIQFYAPIKDKITKKENSLNLYEGYCLIAEKGSKGK